MYQTHFMGLDRREYCPQSKNGIFGTNFLLLIYRSEVFDPLVKRMSYRKQKRWWNAFMLFYTRVDYTEDENESLLKEMALLSIGNFVCFYKE